MANVRYMVNDVEQAIAFYTTHLGFAVEEQWGPAMAILVQDDLHLWLAGPQTSAARPMPDGKTPEPGGWNRIVITLPDLAATVAQMKQAGVSFRNEIISGPGGLQILANDPSGNPIELFQER